MTREQARTLAPIITAYGEGKEIEVRDSQGRWHPSPEPSFTFHDMYRIKNPESVPLVLEVGKTYLRRDGEVTLTVLWNTGWNDNIFTDGVNTWYSGGSFCASRHEHSLDLIKEYHEPRIS